VSPASGQAVCQCSCSIVGHALLITGPRFPTLRAMAKAHRAAPRRRSIDAVRRKLTLGVEEDRRWHGFDDAEVLGNGLSTATVRQEVPAIKYDRMRFGDRGGGDRDLTR